MDEQRIALSERIERLMSLSRVAAGMDEDAEAMKARAGIVARSVREEMRLIDVASLTGPEQNVLLSVAKTLGKIGAEE